MSWRFMWHWGVRSIWMSSGGRASRGWARDMRWRCSFDRLGGTVHAASPDRDPPGRLDRLRSKVFPGSPAAWSLARRLSGELGCDDVVYCSGEDIGIPLVAALGDRADRPRVFVLVHNLDRPRGRAAAMITRFGAGPPAWPPLAAVSTTFSRRRWASPDRSCISCWSTLTTASSAPGRPARTRRVP